MRKIAVLVVVLACSVVASGAAALASEEIRAARHALRTYDVSGDGTLDVIERLARVRDGAPADVREARFLRAMAASDLLIVAARTGDGDLRDRVAGAFGVAAAGVEEAVRAELAQLTFGAYGDAARDARAALGIVVAMREGERPDWSSRRGARGDALFLAAAREAAEEGTLARLGRDPCGAGACEEPYGRLSAEGRRAAAALAEAGGALAGLRAAELHGDPLAVALAEFLAYDRIVLESVTVRAAPRIGDALDVVDVSDALPEAAPDAVMAVTEGEVRWAWVPRVRLAPDGSLEAVAPGEPVLPATESIALPSEVRAVLRPLDRVQRVLEHVAAVRPGAELAVGASDDAPAHLLARVLYGAERAGIGVPLLLGRDAMGVARAVPAEVVSARESAEVRRQLRVRVRLGGYSLHGPAGGETDIPRVRDDRDRLRFDVATLATTARRQRYTTASVSFMSAVEAGPLLAAAFTVAPRDTPLTLILP